MTLRADLFPKLRTPENVVRYMSNGKRVETLFKAERQQIYHIYWSLWRQFSWTKSLWVIWKMLGLFVIALTANDKYSLLNSGNLLQHFQVQLSRNRKIFSEFFSWHFLNLESILNIFRKKTALKADVFLNLRTPENVVRYTSKNSYFRWPFEKEHRKWSEILLKAEGQHLYYIYWSLGRQFRGTKSVSWWHDKCQDCFLTH